MDKLKSSGLLAETEAWALASEQLYVQCWKIDVEGQRHNSMLSGYEWSVCGGCASRVRADSATPLLRRQICAPAAWRCLHALAAVRGVLTRTARHNPGLPGGCSKIFGRGITAL